MYFSLCLSGQSSAVAAEILWLTELRILTIRSLRGRVCLPLDLNSVLWLLSPTSKVVPSEQGLVLVQRLAQSRGCGLHESMNECKEGRPKGREGREGERGRKRRKQETTPKLWVQRCLSFSYLWPNNWAQFINLEKSVSKHVWVDFYGLLINPIKMATTQQFSENARAKFFFDNYVCNPCHTHSQSFLWSKEFSFGPRIL